MRIPILSEKFSKEVICQIESTSQISECNYIYHKAFNGFQNAKTSCTDIKSDILTL